MERNLAAYSTKIRKQIQFQSKKFHPNIVKLKGKDITNPTEIANAFNFFYKYWP